MVDNKLKRRTENKAKLKTYSKRMKSFSKINTFYFILKQKRKKGGLQKIKIRTWLIQHFFTLQLSINILFVPTYKLGCTCACSGTALGNICFCR